MEIKNSSEKQEVNIVKIFDAPLTMVWEVWTNPELLMKWYAPNGCTIHFKTIEIETGGKIHSCISNPEFGDCWCIGEYKEIVPKSKIVFTMINADENGNAINPTEIGMSPDWPAQTLVTVTLSEESGKTKLQLHQTVSQEIAIKTGAYPSWLQMLDNIQHLLH